MARARRTAAGDGGGPDGGRGGGAALGTLLTAVLAVGCGSGAGGTGGDPFDDLDEVTGLPDEPRATASGEFWDHWGDGRAELSGYRLQVRRYGELRDGELVLVYVTEPHDRRTWIKDDHVEAPQRVEVMKVLASRTFDAGIYPYTVSSGVFAPVDRWRDEPFQPVRVEMDAQEWCGTESHRLWVGPEGFRSLRLSYFDDPGESLAEGELRGDALVEDALLVQLRELDGPFAGGGEWKGALVPDLWRLRAELRPPEPVEASIARSDTVREGTGVTRFRLRYRAEGRDYERTFDVEREEPRRVLGWTTRVDGDVVERAELLDTTRLAYWELNHPGGEAYREELGLPAAPRWEGGASREDPEGPSSGGPVSFGPGCGP